MISQYKLRINRAQDLNLNPRVENKKGKGMEKKRKE
jgi:hypothetical protein